MTPPILLNLAYFILTSIMGGGLNTYLVVALGALHATPVDVANMALTSLLAMNAVGVLAGGVAGRPHQPPCGGRGVRPRRRRHGDGAGRLVRFPFRRPHSAHGLAAASSSASPIRRATCWCAR